MTRLGLVAGVLGGPRPALHQPAWADEAERDQVTKALRELPSLVFAGEARPLPRRQFPQKQSTRR